MSFPKLLTLAYPEFTDCDFIVSLNAVAEELVQTILITCDLQGGSVSGVSIVSTLCSDSH